MNALPIVFGAPTVLFGLAALPIIWWLLRLTPPRPKTELFPPLRILAKVLQKEETPAKSPWWLTALRLLIAALIVITLAKPVINPTETQISADGTLAIVMDNGWSTASDWQDRVNTAAELIDDAEAQNVPVSIVFTADALHNATPDTATRARERLQAAVPRPIHNDPRTALSTLVTTLERDGIGTLAVLTSGIARDDSIEAWQSLMALSPGEIRIVEKTEPDALALTAASNEANGFSISASRLGEADAETRFVTANDSQGRPIASGELTFEAASSTASTLLTVPFELRNDFASITVDGGADAGSRYLLDENARRRRVGLISAEPIDLTQQLLSPLFYLTRALEPFADLVVPEAEELSSAISELIEQRPSVIVMADIGTIPDEMEDTLFDWINKGGLLLRFAGPRIAGGDASDPFVPVELRRGERALGGALSWSEPQPLAAFAQHGAFAGLSRPDDVTVNRQVLAEPSPDLAARTWASLADGTPLVTSRAFGSGRIILFHVTAEATWSNLPISGHFVEMLRRSVMLSRSAIGAQGVVEEIILPPYRLLSASGAVTTPSGAVQPLKILSDILPQVSFDNPPGLYGTESGFIALNLMRANEPLPRFTFPEFSGPVQRVDYTRSGSTDLAPYLLTAAFVLLLADTLIVLFMSGAFSRLMMRNIRKASGTTAAILLLATALAALPAELRAADNKPGDADILASLDRTHLAYVITGDQRTDRTSRLGLNGMTRFLNYRTSLEPGDPVGVDIETDPLSLYSMLYWPMSVDADPPSREAISRIDTFMKNGGTVLFDTRDALAGLSDQGLVTPETALLRAILAEIDIPALEPVPQDHVLTKAFYILNEFPGRYRGSPLWVEAILDTDNLRDRPARGGDGVSSIIITGNDLAGAWAIDEKDIPLFPTVPPDPLQREHAYRSGVNIMMYMLTGNYKADQVHVPALLERLGQ
ncbi:MAG: DUF4159 domain-containing protein [Hyphomicrobiales bacterium]|nr:DUF4159 domain-containing protein [Hyphomicrobiales bacterium]MCP5000388.1 DUF4159 domain-containing protein [Hyphomicrobiales bacterium]